VCRAKMTGAQRGCLVGLEYALGSIDLSTGTFTDGVAMPTKTIKDTSLQTAALLAFAWVSSAGTTGAPNITITYTDQDGNTGATANLVMPSNSIGAFLIQPHLASGDVGIRDVTNVTKSAGTVGTVNIAGLLLLENTVNPNAGVFSDPDLLSLPGIDWLCEPAEKIAVYNLGAGPADTSLMLVGIPA